MRLFDVFGNFKRSFYSNFLQNLKEHIMWKKSLLALLVVSPIAFSQVEKSKKKKKLHEVFKMCYLRRWAKDN